MLTRPELVLCRCKPERNRNGKGSILGDGANAEHCANSDWTRKHQQTEQRIDAEIKPQCVDGRVRVLVDLLPPPTAWQRAISGVSVDHSAASDDAPKLNAVLCNDVNTKHRKTGFGTKYLEAQCSHWLPQGARNDIVHVHDRISDG